MINRPEQQAVPMFVPSISSPDPLRRWQESLPEDEPALFSTIRDAIQDSWSANEGFTAVEHQQGIPDPGFVDVFQIYRR
ncbi:unnamed protein product [Aspergillus oryzae]|uniref:Unnamed protein product n=2 Tax=Aspergillus oryzae TaxID=5062 RepID=A0AAN4YRK4_ASPOZ|nr:unnamed protein product [Aspergillus oryzae]GMF83296.1 unnamed protein product [Aspergillus oryzae]GMG02151.1 unnamed protein product [Aspergillus oryzae]GMG33321.1 unnamed protein product [Aspergillus oryzae]GMG41727.1 unnamed protein product [Aspergillus oryzae var. brunneus]